jgi:hypothetical protein
MLSKGFAAEETKDAFARARALAGGKENPAERFPAYFAQWVRSLARGEHRRAQRAAETFLREAEEGGYSTEAGFARRCLGASCYYQGKLLEAQTHQERALADYQPDRDAQTPFRFGHDTRIVATATLVATTWHLGQVERARQLAEQAVQSAAELGHVPTGAFAHAYKTGLEVCGMILGPRFAQPRRCSRWPENTGWSSLSQSAKPMRVGRAVDLTTRRPALK